MVLIIKGRKVLLDDADWDQLRQFKFTVIKSNNTYYCRRTTGKSEMMHRIILGLPYGDRRMVDHVNGNGLDNRRQNLRVCDHSTNAHNTHYIGGQVPFMGVFMDGKKYRAMIRVKGKRIHLGNFTNPILAARAYDRAAKRYFGDFATTLNEDKIKEFIENKEESNVKSPTGSN